MRKMIPLIFHLRVGWLLQLRRSKMLYWRGTARTAGAHVQSLL